MTTEHNKARELTAKQIREGWERLFSTENPFNPVTLKAFTKVVQWVEHQHRAAPASLPQAQEPASQEAVKADSELVQSFRRTGLEPAEAVGAARFLATPEPARAKAADEFLVLRITTAYEQGFGHAWRDELSNPYETGSAEKEAWDHGREVGRSRSASTPTEPARVQGEPVAWRFTGPGGMKPFLTQAQYEAQTIGVKKWYEPFRCATCATLDTTHRDTPC